MPLEAPVTGMIFITGEDIQDKKMKLVVVKAPEEIKANEGFGDKETGMTTRYYFINEKDQEVFLDTGSSRLAKAFNKAELDAGDVIMLGRTGKAMKTDYTVEKVAGEAKPKADAKKDLPLE